MRRPGPGRRRRGFTLVEAAISTAVVAVLLVSSLETVGAAARARAIHAERRMASALAQHLMAEILVARYKEPCQAPIFGREAGEPAFPRTLWNDIDDYHGMSESPPRRQNGAMLSADGWRREVEVRNVSPNNLSALAATNDQGLRRITVTVTSPRGAAVSLVALRSAAGAYEQPHADLDPRLTRIVLTLQTPGSADLTTATDFLNRVRAP